MSKGRRLICLIGVLLIAIACLAADRVEGDAAGQAVLKGVVDGKAYGLLLTFDMAGIESYLATQVAAGCKIYSGVRVEIRTDGVWHSREYTVDEFVKELNLKPMYCCVTMQMEKDEPQWQFCPYCGGKK